MGQGVERGAPETKKPRSQGEGELECTGSPPFPGLPFPPCLADMGGSGGDVEETNAAEGSKFNSDSQEEKMKKRKKKLGLKRKKKFYSPGNL